MTQFLSRIASSRARLLIVALVIISATWAIRHWAGVENAAARPPVKAAANSTATNKPTAPNRAQSDEQQQPIVALVNGQTIMHDELAKECLRHHGKEVLESLVNRRLIDMHCRDRGVTVSQSEIDQEIDSIARKFSLPKDQYLKMLEKERGIKPAQYGRDIVWPTLALRKLAAAELTVSPDELNKAYESQFGEAVKARMIVLTDETEANKVYALAKAKPGEFGALAAKYSKDVNSASANGLIQPIRRHLGDEHIEQVAFQLKPGQVSPVIPIGHEFVILKSEGMVDAVPYDRKKYDQTLTEAIKERKLRAEAAKTFQMLQKNSKLQNVMNDEDLSRKMPGVAAILNGEKITLAELAEQCVERHGKDVLEGVVHRRLLEQALKRRKLVISDADIQEEVERAAIAMGKTLPNKQPDIKGWLEMVTESQGITEEVYVHDVVWPSVAMKKIVGNAVKVTDEDMQKGFEANYGPRVRCRAIVLNSQRKAQEVWDLARQDLTVKKFGDLAEEYSIEANSRSLRGEIPPIQKWGGQPALEKQAFALRAGEISGVIQVGENFVILFCEGYTKPVNKDPAVVKDQLFADILEKKQRLAMAETFDKLKADATIDNYLAGTSQSPKREKELLEEDKLEQMQIGRSAKRPDPTVRSAPKR